MRKLFFVPALLLLLSVGLPAQDASPENVFTIKIAEPTLPKDVQVRYSLNMASPVLNSSAKPDENQILVRTEENGKAAKSFRAIVYSPGCQFGLIRVDDLSSGNHEGDFQCQQLGTTTLHGKVDTSRFSGRKLQVEVLYSCDWAGKFFGMSGFAISPISLTKANVDEEGTFAVEVPDFGSDPSWANLSRHAALMFQLVERDSNQQIGALWTTQQGLVKVAASYPEEIQFTTDQPQRSSR